MDKIWYIRQGRKEILKKTSFIVAGPMTTDNQGTTGEGEREIEREGEREEGRRGGREVEGDGRQRSLESPQCLF